MQISRFHPHLAKILELVLSPFGYFEWGVVLVKDLDEDVGLHRARIPIKVRDAQQSDLTEISKATPYHRLELLEARHAVGNKCLVAWSQGDIAGFNWYIHGRLHDGSFWIDLNAEDVFCMDAMTYELFRGQAVHTELLSHLLLDAKQEGFRKAYTRVSLQNVSSWKTHLKLGWSFHATILSLRLRPSLGGSLLSWPVVYPLSKATRSRTRRSS